MIPDGIFKAYDVRGLCPQELNEDVAARLGYALAQQLGAATLGAGMDPGPRRTLSSRRSRPEPPPAAPGSSISGWSPPRCSTTVSPPGASTVAP